MIIERKLPQRHLDILNDDHRFKVIIAGRRGGKTEYLISEVMKHLTEPSVNVKTGTPLLHRISYICPTYTQAKTIFWDRICSALHPIIMKKNETERVITFLNGGQLKFWGSDFVNSAPRGGYDTLQLFDEFAYHCSGVHDEIFRARQADTQARAVYVSSPKNKNQAYEFYMRGISKEFKHWKSWKFTSLEGGYITQAELDLIKKEIPDTKFRQEYMAEFLTNTGGVVLDWSEANEDQSVEYIPDKPIYLSCDFNWDHMAWVLFHRVGNDYLVFDELMRRNTNTLECAKLVAKKYKNHKNGIIVTGDVSGGFHNQVDGRKNYGVILDELDKQGIKSILDLAGKANPQIVKRIDAFNMQVSHPDHGIRVRVNPVKCPVLCWSMQNVEYDASGERIKMPTKSEINDNEKAIFGPHALDAISYGTWRYTPLIESEVMKRTGPQYHEIPWETRK